MKVRFSDEVDGNLKKIYKKNKKLAKLIEKQLKIFRNDPRHPSLRIHKLSGRFHDRWSISITRGIRMIYSLLDEDEAYFTDIGTHDQVYRK